MGSSLPPTAVSHTLSRRSLLVFVVTVSILLTNSQVSADGQLVSPMVCYSSRHQVLAYNPARGKDIVVFSSPNVLSKIVAFDIDVAGGTVFAVTATKQSNASTTQIMMATNGSNPKHLFKDHGFEHVVDIAADWITKNLYLIEAGGDKLVVCRTDRPYCADLFTARNGAHTLVLDTVRGELYWTEREGRIFQGTMDGKVSSYFTLEQVERTLAIAMDLSTNRFYWGRLRNHTIEYTQLDDDTDGQITIPTKRLPTAMAAFQDQVYWSDISAGESTLSACFSHNCTQRTILGRAERASYSNLKATSVSMQPNRRNPCRRRPCSHICTMFGPGDEDFTCLCPRHFSLTSKTLCQVSVPSFFVAAEEKLFKIPVEAALSNDLSVQDIVMGVPQLAAIVVDDVESVLYAFTDHAEFPRLISINISNGFITELWQGHRRNVSSLQFDLLHRLLYWLDTSHNVVALFNVDRREITHIRLLSSRNEIKALDLGVDVRRGQFYVLSAVGSRYEDRVIERYGFDGKVEFELPKMPYKPERIAVHQSTASLLIYDSLSGAILSFNVQSGASSVIAKGVPSVTELHPWLSRTFWITQRQQGFFGVAEPKANVSHIARKYWPPVTRAIAISGLRVKPIEDTACDVKNGGCSHTCIDSVGKLRTCICPDNMMLGGADGNTCVKNNKTLECNRHYEFACANGVQCIPYHHRCNSAVECDDGSDEEANMCDPSKCAPGAYRCITSLECLPGDLICDGQAHCGDLSDEANCTQHLASAGFRLTGVLTIKWDSQTLIAIATAAAIVILAVAIGCTKWHLGKLRSIDTRDIELATLPVTLSKINPIVT